MTNEIPLIKIDNEKIGNLACDIAAIGMNYERERICSYLLKCAEELDFGKDTPSQVIKSLVEIMQQKEEF